MNHLVRFLLLILSFTPAAFAQVGSGSAETEVRQAMLKYVDALTKRDAAALKDIWAENYVFINGSGALLTKAERLANMASGATTLTTIDVEKGSKVQLYGDTAVVTGLVTIKGQYSGKESSGDYRSLTVWVKHDGTWQLAANQITPIKEKR